MRKIIGITVFLMFFALMIQSVGAVDWTLYVRGKVMHGMKTADDRFYVPVKSFFDALRYGYTQGADGVITIARDSDVKGNFKITSSPVNFSFNNVNIAVPVKRIGNSFYADLDIIALKFNLGVMKTPSTGIIDVVDKVQVQQQVNTMERLNAFEKMKSVQNDGKKAESKADFDPKAPVKQVGEIEGFLDESQWEARWSVKVKNYADKPVNNVRVILHIKDGNKEDLDTQIKVVGTMNPGDISTADYYWQSTTRIMAFPEIEIQNDPLPEEKVVETKNIPARPGETPQEQQQEAPAEAK